MTNQKKNIYEKIMTARLQFLQSNPQKSGYNKFQNFKYFELMDIIPIATQICCNLGLYTHINIDDGTAKMIVLNTENPHEIVEYVLSAPPVQQDKFNNMLQDVGRCETYIRRYLYMLFLDITENDTVDGADQNSFKTANAHNRKSKPAFKTANNVSPKKTDARVKAEKFINYLKRNRKSLDMFSAKLEIANCEKKGKYTMEECVEIIKELEVLLNGN